MKILVFKKKSCGPCFAMDKSRVLEKLVEANPGKVEVIKLDLADENDDHKPGTTYDAAFSLSDDLEIDSTPTLLFMSDDGGELLRWDGGINMRQLQKAFEEAQENINYALRAKEIATKQLSEIAPK